MERHTMKNTRSGGRCQVEDDVLESRSLIGSARIIRIARRRPTRPIPGCVFIPVDVDGQWNNRQLAHHDILDTSDSLLLSRGVAGCLELLEQLIGLLCILAPG